jgi:hypothetical protein
MIINDTIVFLLVFGVFAMLAAAVSEMTRKYYKKKLAFLKQYAEAEKNNPTPAENLHYTPQLEATQQPPAPGSPEYERQRDIKTLEEILIKLGRTPEALAPPPPPPQATPPTQKQQYEGNRYTLKVGGEEPAEPRSFFQSTAFKALGITAAGIIGFLAYLFIFLPK